MSNVILQKTTTKAPIPIGLVFKEKFPLESVIEKHLLHLNAEERIYSNICSRIPMIPIPRISFPNLQRFWIIFLARS